MTWQALRGRTAEQRRRQAIYRELMAHQPPAYQLPLSALRASREHVLECVYLVRMYGQSALPADRSPADAVRQLLAL